MDSPAYYEWQDEILEEEQDSLIACLGPKQARVVSIEKTAQGYRFVECCDEYYGTTLSQEQFKRFTAELQALAGTKPHGQ